MVLVVVVLFGLLDTFRFVFCANREFVLHRLFCEICEKSFYVLPSYKTTDSNHVCVRV